MVPSADGASGVGSTGTVLRSQVGTGPVPDRLRCSSRAPAGEERPCGRSRRARTVVDTLRRRAPIGIQSGHRIAAVVKWQTQGT